MGLLTEKVQDQVREMLAAVEGPVKLVLFTQSGASEQDCALCKDTRQLIEEVAELSDKVSLEVYDFDQDQAAVTKYQVDKVPALVVEGQKDYGIRLYGIPSGYEFSTLIEDILLVSRGKVDLSEKTLAEIGKLTGPVRIQVYTTPT